MRVIEQINTALSMGLAKAVFDHARNFLVCAFILAIAGLTPLLSGIIIY